VGDLFGVCDYDEDGDDIADGVSGMFSEVLLLSVIIPETYNILTYLQNPTASPLFNPWWIIFTKWSESMDTKTDENLYSYWHGKGSYMGQYQINFATVMLAKHSQKVEILSGRSVKQKKTCQQPVLVIYFKRP
jgi:hypothetical protein